MKKLFYFALLFLINNIYCGKGLLMHDFLKKKKLENLIHSTNLSSKDLHFLTESLNSTNNYEGVIKTGLKVIIIRDVKSLLVEVEKVTNLYGNWRFMKKLTKDYLQSKVKIFFLKNTLTKKLPYDDNWDEGSFLRPRTEYYRSLIHSILIFKQINYNSSNKKYSEHIIKDILPKIKSRLYGEKEAYQNWLTHKAKAKKEGWKIADEDGQ